MNNRKFGIADALKSLAPGSLWKFSEEDYDTIEWLSEDIDQPSKELVEQKIRLLQAEYDALEYQRLRRNEYPDFADYLDGIVKNNQDQIDAYIAACLAVKEKYPKPS